MSETGSGRSTSRMPGSVVLAGAGKMGGAMLRGWLDAGLAAGNLAVVDPHPSAEMLDLAKARGFPLNPDLAALPPPDVLVLAVKPQMLDAVAPTLAPLALSGTVLVSIMAGKTIADITAKVAAQAVVRAMPNTPAAIGRGITGAFANAAVSAAQRAMTHALLACVGQVEWLHREDDIDAVTAVSGSGPAYVFLLAECLGEAGRAAGLDEALAARLARATVEGAGALMAASPQVPPETLRKNVTSPGGTTAAAVDVLNRDEALRALMTRAVAAAKARAAELAG